MNAINEVPMIENNEIDDETIFNYNNGNGTILEKKIINGVKWTIRKHERNFGNDVENFNVYENLGEIDGNILFTLYNDMDFSILEIAYSNKRRNGFDLWLKIRNDQDMIGWINTSGYFNPYRDGAWSILETIELENRVFTVRKVVHENCLHMGRNLEVRDIPSINGNVLFQLDPEMKLIQFNAMTEETEIIDGKNDHWLYIIDENGRTGWIFGGNAYLDGRGGHKYIIPDNSIISPFIAW
jgi:hypothetical protein